MQRIGKLGVAFVVCATLAVAGSYSGNEAAAGGKDKPAKDKGKDKKDHAHGAGPHGAAVGDWGGGKMHFEFTVSHPKKEARIYILGSDEKTATPIKAKDD